MAFKREHDKKGISLPGLIDIIFLLLIFALVTLSVSQAKIETKKRGNQSLDFDLPETQMAETEEIGRVLENLMFEIGHTDMEDQQSPLVVYALFPNVQDSITYEEAKANASRDSLFHVFPKDFLQLNDRDFRNLEACRFMSRTIKAYKDVHFQHPDPFNSIEIRAVKDTEFRIINHLMNTCSAYGDTIPRIVIRTLTGKEEMIHGI